MVGIRNSPGPFCSTVMLQLHSCHQDLAKFVEYYGHCRAGIIASGMVGNIHWCMVGFDSLIHPLHRVVARLSVRFDVCISLYN